MSRATGLGPAATPLADLGDLRPALERVQVALRVLRATRRRLLLRFLEALLGLGGRLQGDRVAGRHRGAAAVHDGVAEDVLYRQRFLRLHRALAGDHATQEPAGAVDADEADELDA